jgi:hypothetical protein
VCSLSAFLPARTQLSSLRTCHCSRATTRACSLVSSHCSRRTASSPFVHAVWYPATAAGEQRARASSLVFFSGPASDCSACRQFKKLPLHCRAASAHTCSLRTCHGPAARQIPCSGASMQAARRHNYPAVRLVNWTAAR